MGQERLRSTHGHKRPQKLSAGLAGQMDMVWYVPFQGQWLRFYQILSSGVLLRPPLYAKFEAFFSWMSAQKKASA